jgi:hypothetical protein
MRADEETPEQFRDRVNSAAQVFGVSVQSMSAAIGWWNGCNAFVSAKRAAHPDGTDDLTEHCEALMDAQIDVPAWADPWVYEGAWRDGFKTTFYEWLGP